MKPITRWERWYPPVTDKKTGKVTPGYWEFNHIEDGHSVSDTPADPFNRNWNKAKWQRQYGVLEGVGQFGAPVVRLLEAI